MDSEKIEHKTLDVKFEQSAFSEDEEYYRFSGYASTFGNVDLGGDVIERGAFTKTLSQRLPKLLNQHNMQEPLGSFTAVKEDDRGLYVEGMMPKSVEKCRDVAAFVKCGAINSMSIGFSVPKGGMSYDSATDIRKIKQVDLYEASFVTLPMNPEAKLTAFKSMESIRDVEISLRERGFSTKEAKTLISKIKEFSLRDEGETEHKRDVAAQNNLKIVIDEINKFTTTIKNQNISPLCQNQ